MPHQKAANKKACKHRSLCQCTQDPLRCCMCLNNDGPRKYEDDQKPFYPQDYEATLSNKHCEPCKRVLVDKFTLKYTAKVKAFNEWKKAPMLDMERSTLFVNFLLRDRFPFEIAQITLSFLVQEAPCAFFSTYDRVVVADDGKTMPSVEDIARDVGENVRFALYNSPADPMCEHTHCNLGAYKMRMTPCCACADSRKYKGYTIEHPAGKPDRVVEVPFYKFYCEGCQKHYSNPQVKSLKKNSK